MSEQVTKSGKQENKRNGVGLFRGIQSRILALTIFAVVISVALFMWTGIKAFSKAMTSVVMSNMQGQATAYGEELRTAVTANNNTMLSADNMALMLQNVTVEGVEGSYCYVVDASGTMLYHPIASKIGQPVENVVVTDLVRQIQSGTIPQPDAIEYDFKGSMKLAGYSVLKDGSAIVVLTADKDAALEAISDFVRQCVGVTVLILVIVIVLGTVISLTIARPIRQLTEVIDRNAALDFCKNEVSEALSKGQGETAVMSRALESMRENLVGMVEKMADTAEKLQINSDGLKGIVEELNSNSCDNSATSQELAASMEETSATTQVIDERMSDVNENAKKIGELTTEGEKNAESIIEKAEGLKKSTEEANTKTREIYSRVKKESDVAIEKAKEISQINALTDAIAAIASQTELLSLNASIEAARAGEAGRGFAVVAGEIGNLASQSTETAKNITAIVSNVKDAADSMEECLLQMIHFMEETVIADYENFIKVSEEYSADARGFSGSMKNINDSITELEENISNIANSVQDINRTVGEAAISINDIAEKATDMVGYANDTGDKASDNAEFAKELDDMVKQFKI